MAGCVRLLFFALWRAFFAALLAMVLARLDDYLDRSGRSDSSVGRAWRLYRSRGGKGRRTQPRRDGEVVDTAGRPRP